ncbi:MAG TPA: hypothetical protein P5110_06600 [Candidatus Omnitrophota bacterium]|nr:hypothetical protein [Candidatus Omnitrophota bacterium]HRZ15159.1 hypothetical protein [Candidatus Omnitrophota bacterium]
MAVVFFCACLAGAHDALAEKKSETTIKYIPRDHSMQTVRKNFSPPLKLYESTACKNQFLIDMQNCNYCMQLWRSCPDCCLVFYPDGSMYRRCTKFENSIYDCADVPFNVNDCPAVTCPAAITNPCAEGIPHCQQRGCPANPPAPNGSCESRDGFWYCPEDDYEPQPFCHINCATVGSCPVEPYYDIDKLDPPPPPPDPKDPPPAKPTEPIDPDVEYCQPPLCFKYSPTANFRQYVQACHDYTTQWEECRRGVDCCRRDLCNGMGIQVCLSCETRINNTQCRNFTLPGCQETIRQYNEFITNADTAKHCFEPIDETALTYSFVAKSNEKVSIIWQLQAECPLRNEIDPLKDILFYSMIKVFEGDPDSDTSRTLIHQSPFHARSMRSSFSINGLTSVPKDKLKSSRKYTVVVYYFIPPSDYQNMHMELSWAELIILRNRQ